MAVEVFALQNGSGESADPAPDHPANRMTFDEKNGGFTWPLKWPLKWDGGGAVGTPPPEASSRHGSTQEGIHG